MGILMWCLNKMLSICLMIDKLHDMSVEVWALVCPACAQFTTRV